MKIRNALFLIQCICIVFISTGCSSFNIPAISSESTSISIVEDSGSVASSDTSLENADEESIAEREAQFMKIANRDNYIVGKIIESEFNPYPEECYLVLQCEDKQYRVSGRFGMAGEGLQPFSIGSFDGFGYGYSDIATNSFLIKESAFVFYADELLEGETNINNATLMSFYYPPSMGSDWDINREILKIQYSAQILKKNFSAIEDKKIYTPDEAMLRVADYLQIENPQKVELSAGRNMYTDGKVKIIYETMKNNLYFSVDRAYLAEIFQQDRFLDTNEYPYESTTATPFIHYLINVYDAKGEVTNNTIPIERYAVDITGQILDPNVNRYVYEP